MDKLTKRMSVRTSKKGISGEVYGAYNKMEEFKPKVVQKSDEQKDQIKKTLLKSFMFNTLNQSDMKTVIEAMEVKNYSPNEFVIK